MGLNRDGFNPLQNQLDALVAMTAMTRGGREHADEDVRTAALTWNRSL